MQSLKHVENACLVFRGDSNTVILHPKTHAPLISRSAHVYMPVSAGFAKLSRISNQIREHLAQHYGLREHGRQKRNDFNGEGFSVLCTRFVGGLQYYRIRIYNS